MKSLFQSKYTRDNYAKIIRNVFAHTYNELPMPEQITGIDTSLAKEAHRLGVVKLACGKEIAVYETVLLPSCNLSRNRVGIRNLLRSSWKFYDGAFIASYKPEEDEWRFSFLSETKDFDDQGNYVRQATQAKRYTYLFGETHPCRTANERFAVLKASRKELKDIIDAFSVEALSDEFFEKYKEIYADFVEYVTGKRYVKKGSKWEEKFVGKPDESTLLEDVFNNDEKAVRDYVKKTMGRLVFLQFLQKKGWLDVPANQEWGNGNKNYLQDLFNNSDYKDNFLEKVLEPLFFNTLNTKRDNDIATNIPGTFGKIPYLNGGLFENDFDDDGVVVFPEKYFKNLIDFFGEYNFTIDENDPNDLEIGIDPEMLGKIFENLLEDNKDKGAYYTPKEIAQYMCRESLIAYLSESKENDKIRQFVATHTTEDFTSDEKEHILQKLKDVKICDPAIGSGAFPMGMLNELFACRTALEDISESPAQIKREIIQNNIYGVDIEKGAIDIARLRFWLAIVVDSDTPEPLPNFDYKIVEGNSLLTTFNGKYLNISSQQQHVNAQAIGVKKEILQKKQKDFFTLCGKEKYEKEKEIKNLILDIIELQLGYERTSWVIKQYQMGNLFQEFEQRQMSFAEIAQKIAPEKQGAIELCANIRKLLNDDSKPIEEQARTQIPFFDWQIIFADVFDPATKQGGFDIVIGNPPYIQLHNDGGKLAKLYADCNYKTFARTGDIYCLFYERGHQLLKSNGHLCYITSNKWMRAGYGEKTRDFFAKNTNPMLLIDFAGVKIFESATVDTNILLFAKAANEHKTWCAVTNKQNKDSVKNLSVFVQQSGTKCEFCSSDSWVILSPIEQSIKRKIEAVGTPLKDWDIQINYGIKTGYNDAFIIDTAKRDEILANCQSEDERERTAELIRPILRGRDIKRYGYEWDERWLIATFPSRHYDIENYPAVKNYLLSFGKERLEQTGLTYEINGETVKARKKTNNKWFETQDSISYWDLFFQPYICWKAVGRQLAFALVDGGVYITAPASFISAGLYNNTILTYLRSNVAKYFIYKNSDTTGAGDIMLNIQSLVKFPIPMSVIDTKRMQDDNTELMIYSSYRFTNEEIKYIESQI